MATITKEQAQREPAAPQQQSLAEIRADLERPLPKLTFRLMGTILIVIAVFYWGILGTDASPAALADGVDNMADFISRLLPPQFEFEENSERAYSLFPFESRVPEVFEGTDRLRPARVADEEDINAMEEGQVIDSLVRGVDNRRFYYSEEVAPEGMELEVTEFILQPDQYLFIDEGPSDVYIMDEGTYFSERYQVPEGQQLVARRYLINEGEIFLGWPILIGLIVETIQMALIGTAGAIILSIPFGLLAARNVSPHPAIYQTTRILLNANRAIPELVYALIFVSAVGLGPFGGVLALMIGSIGSMGKLYAESIEAIDPQQVAAVRATGASQLQVFNYSVIPQAFPMLASYSLLLFEGNVRAATILGIVGAGGVGFVIQKYTQLFQYQNLMGAVIFIIIVVTVFDRISDYIRKRII